MRHEHDSFYSSRDPDAALREDQCEFLENAAISFGLPSLFYGSLRHPRIFRTVVGRSMDTLEWGTATIEGFRFGAVDTGSTEFPGIFPATPAAEPIHCLVTSGLTRFEQTMITWYEWDEYVLQRIALADGRIAQAFVPDLEAIRIEHGRIEVVPWSFDQWWYGHVDHTLARARRWMALRPSNAEMVNAGCFRQEELPPDGRAAG